jgi:hypothetical protein
VAQASYFDFLPQALIRIGNSMRVMTIRAAQESGPYFIHITANRKLIIQEIVERESRASFGPARTDYFIAPRFIGETGRNARSAVLGPMPRFEQALEAIQRERPELVIRPHSLQQTRGFGEAVEAIDGYIIEGATLDPVVFVDVLERLLTALR